MIREALIKAVGIVSDPRKSFAAAAKLTEWVVKRFNQRFIRIPLKPLDYVYFC